MIDFQGRWEDIRTRVAIYEPIHSTQGGSRGRNIHNFEETGVPAIRDRLEKICGRMWLQVD